MKQALTLLAGILGGFTAAGLVLLMISPPRGEPVTLLPPPTPEPHTIHLCGAVSTPGVYDLQPGAIVADAIAAAGGITDKADLARINLASEIQDGQKLMIPYVQPTSSDLHAQAPADTAGELLNLNQASAPELERLPGIGPATAKKIIEYRDINGPFLEVDDLMKVSGIGPAKMEQIRELVTTY